MTKRKPPSANLWQFFSDTNQAEFIRWAQRKGKSVEVIDYQTVQLVEGDSEAEIEAASLGALRK